MPPEPTRSALVAAAIVLGSGEAGGALAAKMGLGFAFAHQLNRVDAVRVRVMRGRRVRHQRHLRGRTFLQMARGGRRRVRRARQVPHGFGLPGSMRGRQVCVRYATPDLCAGRVTPSSL